METLIEHEYGCLKADFTYGNPVLHLQVTNWSHTILKDIVYPLWNKVLSDLKDRGYKAVYAYIPSHEKKIIKFHKIMGMHVVTEENGYTLTGRGL